MPMGVRRPGSTAPGSTASVMAFSVFGFSVPVFVLAYVLAYVFAMQLDWLPVQGYHAHQRRRVAVLRNLILPAAHWNRLHRADRAHHARHDAGRAAPGLCPDRAAPRASGSTVLFGHALKNAAVPIVTIIGIGIALLIGGAVVTESVFAIPGLGRLTSMQSSGGTTRSSRASC